MINKIDKTYCINLDRRPDRWEKMKTQFIDHNIQVERFSAIDGRLLTNDTSYGSSVLGFTPARLES